MAQIIRPLKKSDRPLLISFFKSIANFTEEEQKVAMELVDSNLNNPETGDYLIYLSWSGEQIAGYLCFGPTPMTSGTYDLYWIATHPKFQGQGVAKELVKFMREFLRKLEGRLVRIETASKDDYQGTHQFYLKIGFKEEARIRRFYAEDDDLVIYTDSL